MTGHYQILSGNATLTGSNKDVTGVTTGLKTFNLAKGQSQLKIGFSVVDDSSVESSETFRFKVVDANYVPETLDPVPPTLGVDPREAVVTILDNDQPPPPAVSVHIDAGTGFQSTSGSGTLLGTIHEGDVAQLILSAPELTSSDRVTVRYQVVSAGQNLMNEAYVGSDLQLISTREIPNPNNLSQPFLIAQPGATGLITLHGSQPQEILIFTFGDDAYELNEQHDAASAGLDEAG